MAARLAPQDGDIVVREETRKGTRLYVLNTAPGADQYMLGSREAAVANAVAFAKREGVRAWLTDEGYGCALLEDSRAVDSI